MIRPAGRHRGLGYRGLRLLLSRIRPSLLPAAGPRLRRIGLRLWAAERQVRLGHIVIPLRMVVAADADHDLVCYSPVALDDETVEALQALGRVRWVVVPNRSHRAFLTDFIDRYPDAEIWGAGPGLPAGAFDVSDHRPGFAAWLEPRVVTPRPEESEVCLYHDESATLILSDLAFNVIEGCRSLRIVMWLNGAFGRLSVTRAQRRFVLKDTEAMAGFYRWALARPFVQISVSHGDVVTENARESFYRLFHRYG